MVEIATSLLAVKKEEGTARIYDLEVAHTDYFHIDVMDGEFVEANTVDIMQEFTTIINQISNIPIDVHLMVYNVKEYIDSYIPLNPNIITFHYEACIDKNQVIEIIEYIKNNNVRVGIAIKPDTSVQEIIEFLPYIHQVLIMTVEPGKGGQGIIETTLNKIQDLKQYIIENDIDLDIQADGGINKDTIKEVSLNGLDIAVVGTGIINTSDYTKTIKELKGLTN